MTTPEQNRQTVVDAYVAYAEGRHDDFFALFDAEVELHEASTLPYGGVYKGIKEFRHGIDRMLASWAEMRFEIEAITAGGDLVFVHFNTAATARNGRSYAFPVLELWRFKDGKVIEMRPIYWDTHKAVETFGDTADP